MNTMVQTVPSSLQKFQFTAYVDEARLVLYGTRYEEFTRIIRHKQVVKLECRGPLAIDFVMNYLLPNYHLIKKTLIVLTIHLSTRGREEELLKQIGAQIFMAEDVVLTSLTIHFMRQTSIHCFPRQFLDGLSHVNCELKRLRLQGVFSDSWVHFLNSVRRNNTLKSIHLHATDISFNAFFVNWLLSQKSLERITVVVDNIYVDDLLELLWLRREDIPCQLRKIHVTNDVHFSSSQAEINLFLNKRFIENEKMFGPVPTFKNVIPCKRFRKSQNNSK